jgi:hypothetical protein
MSRLAVDGGRTSMEGTHLNALIRISPIAVTKTQSLTCRRRSIVFLHLRGAIPLQRGPKGPKQVRGVENPGSSIIWAEIHPTKRGGKQLPS